MKINNITLITAAAALAPFALNAQSAPAGAPAASKQAEGIKVTLNDKATITVSGYAQAQYYYSDSKNNSGDANSGFSIRRAAISAKGKIGENWSAEVGFEIDGGKDGGKLDGAFVDKAIISYTSEYGKLTAGYQKTAFAMEEYSSSKTALAIEHGIAPPHPQLGPTHQYPRSQQQSGHALRNDRCSSRPRYAPVEDENEHQVEHNVEHHRKGQEPQRCQRVAHGTEQSRAIVVEEGERYPNVNHPQISPHHPVYLLRCL